MPWTPRELAELAREVVGGGMAIDFLEGRTWADGSAITREAVQTVLAVACWELRRRQERRRDEPQQVARRLLRQLMSREQRRQLNHGWTFKVVGSSGGAYRLCPQTGAVWGLERHGRLLYGVRQFCLHEVEGAPKLPPADLSIAHLLIITTDEPEFLRLANVTERPPGCWDGAWRRRLNEARRGRERALAVGFVEPTTERTEAA